MKAVSAALDAHIGQETTSLATCWRLTRVDGQVFRFTEHDVDITVDMQDGNGPETYLASSSYNRTAMTNDNTLSVDNLDLVGVLSDDAISEADLRKGLFDYATIHVFVVNWADLSMGIMRMRKGTLGEVQVTPNGYFRAELRGLSQFYARRIGESFTPECRADLGDHRCKVPIWPDVLGRNDTVALGEFYRVNTLRPRTGNIVTNGGFESGTTGWTLTGTADDVTSTGLLLPYADNRLLSNSNAANFSAAQTIDFSSLVDLGQVDAGNYYLDFSTKVGSGEAGLLDQGRVTVEVLDAADLVLDTPLDTGPETYGPVGAWLDRVLTNYQLPAGAEKIRITLYGIYVAGAFTNIGFDEVFAELHPVNETDTALYESRVYEVTTAGATAATQPVYDTTIGNPTTDGTAVLTARVGRSLPIAVTAVDGTLKRKKFTVTALTPDETYPTGWFNYGAVTWDTGPNAGKTMEVRAFTGGDASQVIELFLDLPYDIEVGDSGRIYPGCDKRRSTCITKFANILNFRGEPFLAGTDQVFTYPTS